MTKPEENKWQCHKNQTVRFHRQLGIERKKKFLLLLLIFKILEKGFFLNILLCWFRFLLHWTKRDRQNQANIYFSQSFVAIATSSSEIQTLTGSNPSQSGQNYNFRKWKWTENEKSGVSDPNSSKLTGKEMMTPPKKFTGSSRFWSLHDVHSRPPAPPTPPGSTCQDILLPSCSLGLGTAKRGLQIIPLPFSTF